MLSQQQAEKETARVEAFSDGVFAIAITLLVLELKVPAVNQVLPLGVLLARAWPSYLAFVMSFAFIGIMWMNHHRLFTHIHRCNHPLLVLNLLLLFTVTVVPFPTALLAAWLGTRDARTAMTVYDATYVGVAIAFNALWRYASGGHRLLAHDVDRAAVREITRQYSFGPLLYLACLLLAWVSVAASLVLNVALALFFALPPKRIAAT